jgi:hypothetical protein
VSAIRPRPPDTLPTVGYGSAWLTEFLRQGSGLAFDERQVAQIASLAERKLVDFFDVGAATALANGRRQIMRHDLPLTKGLRRELLEAETLASEVQLRPVLAFLADAGIRGPLDERVHETVPCLMAALLLIAARAIAIVEPSGTSTEERLDRLIRHRPTQPTAWEFQRATRVLNLTL